MRVAALSQPFGADPRVGGDVGHADDGDGWEPSLVNQFARFSLDAAIRSTNGKPLQNELVELGKNLMWEPEGEQVLFY